METTIKSFANRYGYSDVHPYEVVRVVSAKCVEVRALDYVQTVFPKDFNIGGFVANCADQHIQEYDYIVNPENAIIKIRLGKRGWNGGKFQMEDKPYRFYDYNF